MINDAAIDEMIQPILNLYSQMEMDLMVEVAKRFANYDEIAGSLEWQLKKLGELGGVNKKLIQIIKQYSDLTEPQIEKLLQQAGYINLDVNALQTAYELGAAAVDINTLMQSENIAKIIELSYKSLTNTFSLINTKALERARQKYLDILNTAYLDTATGIHSFQESVNTAIQRMAKAGIGGATYKRGNKYVTYSLEGTVRRDTLTAVHQLANKVSIQTCEDMGAEYVEVSQHLGARVSATNPIANHAGWQGKVFKIEGKTDKYPNLKESTGYPDDILGLGGVNCRHRMFPFFPGISIPNPIHYNEEENRKVYEATQHQRKLERDIRALKKQKACAEAIGDEDTAALLQNKLNQKYDEIDKWCAQNNLRRDYSRELVSEQMNEKSVANPAESGIILTRKIERKNANIGAFSNLKIPMQKRSVLRICKKYGVDTNGLTIKILRSEKLLSLNLCGSTDYDNIGRFDLFPNAFIDEEQLIKTILHEKCHINQLRKYGKKYCQVHLSEMEAEAYESEKEFENLKEGLK